MSTLSRAFLKPNSAWKAGLIIWLSCLIAAPISVWMIGEESFPLLASLGVLAQLTTVLLALGITWPASQIAKIAVIVLFLSLGIEILGATSGIPFGSYTYTGQLQPQLAGVPLIIPLAWLMMLPPAWAISAAILHPAQKKLGKWYAPILAVMAGLAFTAWDLYLDPQMTKFGLWSWEQAGGYFGIPWVNYLGWWLSSAFVTWLVRPNRLPIRPLVWVYTLTWAFQAIGLGLFWGQLGPALAGFAGMGFFVGLSWNTIHRIA